MSWVDVRHDFEIAIRSSLFIVWGRRAKSCLYERSYQTPHGTDQARLKPQILARIIIRGISCLTIMLSMGANNKDADQTVHMKNTLRGPYMLGLFFTSVTTIVLRILNC